MAPKIAILYYSTYGHVAKLAEAEKAGIEAAGGTASIFRVPETLSAKALVDMEAPGKVEAHKEIEKPDVLEKFDGFLFGVPTRYGNMPAQWTTFWEHTGKQWTTGGYWGKYAGLFVSTSSPSGGQESTIIAMMSTLAHHGLIYVPLGYKTVFAELTNATEVHGGSPWGAGTLAGADGARQPTPLELQIANAQGKAFYETLAQVNFGWLDGSRNDKNGQQNDDSLARVVPETVDGSRSTTDQSPAVVSDAPNSKSGPCGLPSRCVLL
ncbi:MAG: Minor allergen Alt a 7 [Sarcosagium campestre]|nr:MAG: Minor allergen Alt a 7 [Sarcosagium campestre]